MATNAPLPLSGVRILDFTHVHAGPAATRQLADYGAQVIKVESRHRADQMRVDAPNFGTFQTWNAGKLDITLNLNHPKAVEIAHRLVRISDVVVDNFSAGTMQRWGLDYDGLRALKPDIIAVSMPGFGFTGPWRDYVSYGYILHALTGYFFLTGHPGQPPSGPSTAYTDTTGSFLGALAILFALVHKARTGRGQFVDVAQLQGVSATLGPAFLDYSVNGRVPQATGNRSMYGDVAPHNIYRCDGEDRWCAITVFTDEQWDALCAVMGKPSWTRDDRFATALGRVQHVEELDRLIEAWTMHHTAEDVQTRLQAVGVPAGIVATGQDIVERDPQLQLRKFFQEVPYAEGGTVIVEGSPLLLSATPGGPQRGAPLLGEHTEFVCRALLGLSDEEFTRDLNDEVFY